MNTEFQMVEDQYTVKVSGISVSKYYPATYWEPAEGGDLDYTIDEVLIGDAEGIQYRLTDEQLEVWCFNYEEKLVELIWEHIEKEREDYAA